ncbi:MBL fold metallo-hydrolase [Dongia sp. agr-C8]
MRIRYIYSACIAIETPDVRILCDPWFTQGAYDGSWYQYPKIEDPVATIGPADLIYVSHIHPDHYDPAFLHRYLDAYPAARLVIAEQEPAFLLRKMRRDGFEPLIVDEMAFGGTRVGIVPNTSAIVNIDTAMAVTHRGQAIVAMNDNPFDPVQIEALLKFCAGSTIEVALIPHSGAGPFPQTFAFENQAELERAVAGKREQFLNLYTRYVRALDPRKVIPYAGQYYLGGPLAGLNHLRGTTDATEAAALYPDKSVVLADGGQAYYDTETGEASAVRTRPYDPAEVEAYLTALPFAGYDYERELHFTEGRHLPLLPLLETAQRAAKRRVPVRQPYWLCFAPSDQDGYLCFNVAEDGPVQRLKDVSHLQPRCEIEIDVRYFFGLLSGLYHWNNAEVGSHYRSRRTPEGYRPEVYRLLDRLHV